MAEAIVADIEYLHDVIDRLRRSESVLVRCANDQWADTSETAQTTETSAQNALLDQARKACAALTATESTDAGGAAGVFSGLTGLDPFSRCGFEVDRGRATVDFAETALKRAQEMAKRCATDLRPIEGDPAPPEDPTPPEDPQPPEDPPAPPEDPPQDPPADELETTYKAPDGTEIKQKGNNVEVRLPDGSLYRSKDGGNTWDRYNGQLVAGCVDDLCGSCKTFFEFHPKLIMACAGRGDARLCPEFANTTSCCDANTVFVDPRVVTPNPMGDLVCMGAPTDLDMRKTRCEARCKVAGVTSTDIDCYSQCMNSSEPRIFKWTLLDAICRYAYSENCFSSAGSIVPPTRAGGWAPDPLPSPPVQQWLMLPLSNRDFRRHSGK
jgi:hypothetical protein